MSAHVNVIQARAHLMQQINDHVRNGYRHWCTGTVPLSKAQAWAQKAEHLYDIGIDRNARARRKKAKLGSAYMYLYPLDRSLDNNRVGWVLLVTDGLHPAHLGEKLHRAEDDPVELFGYQLVREPRAGKEKPVWTWRMKRAAYDAWRERIIDVVRRGSDYDVRRMLLQLSAAPGFAAIRAQIKALHRLVNAEWARRHKRTEKRGYTLPRIWKCARMRIVSVDLSTYLQALHERRREAAAEAAGSAELAPKIEPEEIYPSEPPSETARKENGRATRNDTAQPVRQRALSLLPTPASPTSAPASDSTSAADAG
ncbi:MAG TPA: hypothetical protein VFA39_20095 [Steroidobacteraceae bacterium]|nr:hypothetical protein [Steroidobacteraceae bacterium]